MNNSVSAWVLTSFFFAKAEIPIVNENELDKNDIIISYILELYKKTHKRNNRTMIGFQVVTFPKTIENLETAPLLITGLRPFMIIMARCIHRF